MIVDTLQSQKTKYDTIREIPKQRFSHKRKQITTFTDADASRPRSHGHVCCFVQCKQIHLPSSAKNTIIYPGHGTKSVILVAKPGCILLECKRLQC